MALTPIVVTSGGTSKSVTISAGNRADTAAHGKRGGDVEQHHAGIGAAVRQLGDDHRGKRHDAGGRKIEAALLDHQMLADRGHGEDGEIRQRREDRGGIHRARGRDAADQHQKHGRDEGLSGEWKLGQVFAEARRLQKGPDPRRKRRQILAEPHCRPQQKLSGIFAEAGHSQTQCLLVRHIPHPRPTPPPLIPAHAGIRPDRRTKLGPRWRGNEREPEPTARPSADRAIAMLAVRLLSA